MSFRKVHVTVSAVLAVACVTSPSVFAQSSNSKDTEIREEIVVTAQRRTEVISDVPVAIQAFSGEALEATGVRDLSQLISLVPGASEGRGNAAGIRSYQIRGVSSFYGDSTVGYYLDEAAYVIPNRNYAPVARSFDIERVEVLRGPQGTLYGLGSMGGTIRFITADPDLNAFRTRGAVGYSGTKGGKDNYYGDIAVSAPLVQDRLAIRGVASKEHTGGFAQSPSFPGDWNDGSVENYRLKLLTKPSDDFTIRLAYHRNETSDDWGRNFATTDPAAFPASPVAGRNRQVFDMYTGYISYDVGGALLESSTGYVDRRDRASGPIRLGPGPAFRLDVIGDSDSFVQELRAVSQNDGPLEWVVGGIYQDAKNFEDINVIGGPPISSFSIYDSKSYAAFGEVSWGFLDDRLRPLVGLRYFEDDRDFLTQNRPPGPVRPPPFTTSQKFNSLSPRFNISYDIDADNMVYVNVARGFRSGTFNTASAVAASGNVVGFAVDPDDIWSYEIGGKFWLNEALYAEVALYTMDWSGVQLNYTIAGGVQVIRNAGDVKGTGADVALNWSPTDGLNLQMTGNLNSTEFDSIVNPAAFAATPNIAVDRQLASVPKSTFGLNATYTRPIGDGTYNLYLNGSYTFINKQGDPGDTLARFGAKHDLVRARIGFERDDVGLYLFGDNLLDDSDAIQVSGSGSSRYYPRVIGLELKWDL